MAIMLERGESDFSYGIGILLPCWSMANIFIVTCVRDVHIIEIYLGDELLNIVTTSHQASECEKTFNCCNAVLL